MTGSRELRLGTFVRFNFKHVRSSEADRPTFDNFMKQRLSDAEAP